jgi:threonine synthase
MTVIACTKCGTLYPDDSNPFLCDCGGSYDYLEFPRFLSKNRNQSGVWAYSQNLLDSMQTPIVSLGEGETPLLQVKTKNRQIWLKMESLNPTGSYKDRGSTTLVSHLKNRGVNYAIEDSSGNAGASFAAYCARGSLRCKVFVPESASGPKRAQIEMFGAELVRVPGPRSEAARAVLEEAKSGAVYGSHAFMPFGLPGIATISYELVEQLGEVPAAVVAPVGHGGLMYGMMQGFEAMEQVGFIKRQPFYVGVQAEACAPIGRGFKKGSLFPQVIEPGDTLAEGVKVATPVRGASILKRMQNGKGTMVIVSDETLKKAHLELAHLGIYCEPTSALVWAGAELIEDNKNSATVAVITGSGYKSYQNDTGIV